MEAARELTNVPLEDALGLCLLLRGDSQRYQRAAAKWLVRYHAEIEGVTLTEIRELADLLDALPTHEAGPAASLTERFEQRRLHRCTDRVRLLLSE
jgi:hypothetical protein